MLSSGRLQTALLLMSWGGNPARAPVVLAQGQHALNTDPEDNVML